MASEPGNEFVPAPKLWPSLAGVAVLTLLMVVLGRVWDAFHGSALVNPWTAGSLAVAALAIAAVFRRSVYRGMISLPFSVALLGAILIATVLGTLILQGAPPAEFAAKYPSAGHFLVLAGLDDIFHSFAFRGLLALLAISLAFVVVEKRAWRPAEWGFVLNHAGVIVILAGGIIGSYSGCKGFIDLNEGKTARAFVLRDRFGNSTKQVAPLDFGLRLDSFEVERLPPEFRFYVYKHQHEEWQPLSSWGLTEAMEWTEATGTGKSFRVLAVYPDFELRTDMSDAPEGRGGPGLQVNMVDREGNLRFLNLLAGVEGRERTFFKESKSYLRFAWEERDVVVSTEALPERHSIIWRRGGTEGPDVKVDVKPGETVTLAGEIEVTVVAWYPDFVYDGKTKEGSSKSREPDNPAVKVTIAAPGVAPDSKFLFANSTVYGGDKGTAAAGLLLKYRYAPTRQPAEREIVVIGSTKEVLEYRRGELKARSPLPAKPKENIARGISASVQKIGARVEEVQAPRTRSNLWRNPVAEVQVLSSGSTEKHFLKSTMPFDLGRGEHALVFQPKPDDIKSYRSKVSVLAGDGSVVLQDTISVNHPLTYGGYRFYQSNYRPDDLTYSGILVVKDAGLGTAYAGFLMICLGMIYRFYVHPWLTRRKQGKPA